MRHPTIKAPTREWHLGETAFGITQVRCGYQMHPDFPVFVRSLLMEVDGRQTCVTCDRATHFCHTE